MQVWEIRNFILGRHIKNATATKVAGGYTLSFEIKGLGQIALQSKLKEIRVFKKLDAVVSFLEKENLPFEQIMFKTL